MGDQIMPPPFFRLPSDPDEAEREIKRCLSEIEQEYRRRIRPYIEMLVRLDAMRPTRKILITPEQLYVLSSEMKRHD